MQKYVSKKAKTKKPIKKTTIDYLIYVAVVIGPLMTIPQVYSIWFEKQGGVSIISWIAYFVVSIIWLVYSLKIKDKPMIIVNSIWIALDLLIVVGILRIG